MSYLTRLQLHHFRCYDSARLNDLPAGMIVLCGPNGAGKTNILEAVSLLSPGRGLRGAKAGDMQRRSSESPWAVSAEIMTDVGPVSLGTGLDTEKGRRIIRINGETVRTQTALADYMACVWLTPQMDRLFIEGAAARRRFLDRMLFAFDPGHAGRMTRYENALRQRAKLLQESRSESAWLNSLEAQMAETGVAVAAARADFVCRLQEACDRAEIEETQYFPQGKLALHGFLEEALENSPAVTVEENFIHMLTNGRRQDAESGGTASAGPHKSDLHVFYAEKNMEAALCSTGEQKALLTGLILAHARLMTAERGAPPVLLLDEIAAHLDEKRRAALFDLLESLGGQVWMSGTDKTLFHAAENRAQFYDIQNWKIGTGP